MMSLPEEVRNCVSFFTFILQIKVNETNRKESQGIFTNPSKKITSDKILSHLRTGAFTVFK